MRVNIEVEGQIKRKRKSSVGNLTVNFLANMLDIAVRTLLPKLNQVILDAANTDIGLCPLKNLVEGRSRNEICRFKHDRD